MPGIGASLLRAAFVALLIPQPAERGSAGVSSVVRRSLDTLSKLATMKHMNDRLQNAIEGVRGELEAGLAEAEVELAELNARRLELIALIAQAKAALALEPSAVADGPDGGGAGVEHSSRLTLHDALALVLRENGNQWMTAGELADAINTRGLYSKRDGRPVEINQVHARTKNYPHIFEKQRSRIRLQANPQEEGST